MSPVGALNVWEVHVDDRARRSGGLLPRRRGGHRRTAGGALQRGTDRSRLRGGVVEGRRHDRMPVVRPPSVWEQWLDPAFHDVGALRSLLVPAPSELFDLVAVGTAVNDVRNDGPHLLDPPPDS